MTNEAYNHVQRVCRKVLGQHTGDDATQVAALLMLEKGYTQGAATWVAIRRTWRNESRQARQLAEDAPIIGFNDDGWFNEFVATLPTRLATLAREMVGDKGVNEIAGEWGISHQAVSQLRETVATRLAEFLCQA